MNKFAAFVVLAACFAAAPLSLAQHKTTKAGGGMPKYEAYMTVTGARQGKFRGAGRSKGGIIPVISFVQNMSSNRDSKTGMPSGKRQHSAVTVVIDAVDVKEFQSAMTDNEVLTQVSIVLQMPGGNGRVQPVKRIVLTNAVVTHVQVSLTRGKGGMNEQEKIQLTYQKIQYESVKGKTSATDSWMQ